MIYTRKVATIQLLTEGNRDFNLEKQIPSGSIAYCSYRCNFMVHWGIRRSMWRFSPPIAVYLASWQFLFIPGLQYKRNENHSSTSMFIRYIILFSCISTRPGTTAQRPRPCCCLSPGRWQNLRLSACRIPSIQCLPDISASGFSEVLRQNIS